MSISPSLSGLLRDGSPGFWGDSSGLKTQMLFGITLRVMNELRTNHAGLLFLLDKQIESLVTAHQTDPIQFITSLQACNELPPEQVDQLQLRWSLGSTGLPRQQNANVESLIAHLHSLSDLHGDITVGNVDLPAASFERLRPGQWLSNYIILAALELADKPSYVMVLPIHLSDDSDKVQDSFPAWRSEVNKYKQAWPNKWIFLCPVSLNGHFTLLEINSQLRKIYHYDSMAPRNVKNGKRLETTVGAALGCG
ncbi:hypothetical protein F4778DRAFT_785745 [Xylariomycetidae sp. FL2044]|nr:hypothetical protein F4778DRAFT_785745 [Xylariomycetidae sp. FL2044]